MADITYTPEQYKKVIDFWNNTKPAPSLPDIVNHFTDGVESDARTISGRIVRQILLSAKAKPQTSKWQPVDVIVLDENQKLFIKNNIATMRPYEIACEFWIGQKVEPLGREIRAINAYIDSIGEKVVKRFDKTTFPTSIYTPPASFHEMLKKINIYCHAELSTQNITAYQRKCIEMSVNFLHSPRFIQEINNYTTQEKRTAFEAEFIQSVFLKPDLTPEEIALTINWCNDLIMSGDLKKQLEKLNGLLDAITDDPDAKISMSLTESIGKVTSSYNECVNRHQKLYSLLNTSRSKRILEKNNSTANIVNLIEFFREEEGRKRILKQAELLKDARVSEVKRMEELDDVVLACLGLSFDEAEM